MTAATSFGNRRLRVRSIQTSFPVAIELTLEQARAAPRVNGSDGYTKPFGQFRTGEKSAGAQSLETTPQAIALAHQGDFFDGERRAFPVPMPKLIQPLGGTSIVAGLEQFIERGDDLGPSLADTRHGQGPRHGERMPLPTAEANVHRDLVLIEQGHIFEKKRNEAFSLKEDRSTPEESPSPRS